MPSPDFAYPGGLAAGVGVRGSALPGYVPSGVFGPADTLASGGVAGAAYYPPSPVYPYSVYSAQAAAGYGGPPLTAAGLDGYTNGCVQLRMMP